ncbi:MAG: AtpZ/AtpI family protein [Alphaproteobacteria bacterium]|nr:AtpZ/AtpI family protein [Alphaproteobacteria bacterium]MDX5369308.1 AtpZ/AtpI family protein [Alphaproteobacteria bacterium]MDX5463993.1 AtpZ/AtpI family protein [Alphaproteobacteria bacterium]
MAQSRDPQDGGNGPDDLEVLRRRIGEVETRRAGTGARARGPSTNLGLAFRLSTEIVAAVGVGTAMGLGIDWALGTRPLFMLIFIFLGMAAAYVNMTRVLKQFDRNTRGAQDRGQA